MGAPARRLITNERCFWFGETTPRDLPWSGQRAFAFSSGREALLALLEALGTRPGDGVLLPAFAPEGIVAPCRLKQLDVRFYPVDRNLDPVWNRVEQIASAGGAKLAILIHYFGVRRDAARFADICHARGIPVMEDLAQAHVLPESTLGDRADFVLHSLTKIVGVPDGAILAMSGSAAPLLSPRASWDPRRWLALTQNAGRMAANTVSRTVASPATWKAFNRIMGRPLNSYRILMWYFKRPARMSAVSRLLMRRFPWRLAVERRLGHEKRYAKRLDSHAFRPLYRGPEGTHCAMGYPVLVEDRDALIEALADEGIHGIWFEHKWDYFPPEREHEDGRWVMKHHFLFPTAYALSADEVDRVITIANRWASGANDGSVTRDRLP